MDGGVVIVGAGQAGVQTAFSLRQFGYDDAITLIHDEDILPYQRPPLSKAYLKDVVEDQDLFFRNREIYDDNRITLLSRERATRIDRSKKSVALASGAFLSYDHLVLACGARNNILPITGHDLPMVLDLRSLKDAAILRQALERARRLVVIGGGFIGLEVAATANQLGKSVCILEAADRLMARVVSPEISDYVLARHRAEGMDIRLSSLASGIVKLPGAILGIETKAGEEIPGDLVLVSIGVTPNTELAEGCGLSTDNGIVVDEFLATEDPDISALGDCANFPLTSGSGRGRLESVQNAVDQARCIAQRLTGTNNPYSAVPWFWSDQADLKLQIAGITTGSEVTVILGNRGSDRFSVCCFRGGKFIGTESINSPADHMASRKLLASRRVLDPATAGSPGFSLKGFAAGQ